MSGARRLGAALLLLVLALAPVGASAQPVERQVPAGREQVRLSFAPVVRQVAPGVVSITAKRVTVARGQAFDDPMLQFFFGTPGRPRRQVETSLGSGVLVRGDGIVVTNHHVVEGAEEIEVVLADRRTFAARVVRSDQGSDLAFLRIDAKSERLPTVPLGDSDQAEVGDVVLALGNPFGIGQTVTSGIVSATGRTAPELDRDVSFIQTDAAINPGNSGGALVTLDGRLLGINTAIFSRSGGSIGIGFAIPSNLVRARLAALDGRADLARPWLGAGLRPVDPAIARDLGLDRPRGVLVERVFPASAADRGGLRAGDVITAIDGVEVAEPGILGYRLSLKSRGERVALAILRNARPSQLTVEIEPAPRQPAANPQSLTGRHPLAGATVATLSPGLAEDLKLDPFERGLVVTELARGSSAARLGFRAGDVVESINGEPVATGRDLARLVQQPARGWLIVIRRGGQQLRMEVG